MRAARRFNVEHFVQLEAEKSFVRGAGERGAFSYELAGASSVARCRRLIGK